MLCTEDPQFSAYTLGRMDAWLEDLGAPDIVHWNNGLHDAGHNPNRDPVPYPLEFYEANLCAIPARLGETGAQVIWATTTPVHPEAPWSDESWSWVNQVIFFGFGSNTFRPTVVIAIRRYRPWRGPCLSGVGAERTGICDLQRWARRLQ